MMHTTSLGALRAAQLAVRYTGLSKASFTQVLIMRDRWEGAHVVEMTRKSNKRTVTLTVPSGRPEDETMRNIAEIDSMPAELRRLCDDIVKEL